VIVVAVASVGVVCVRGVRACGVRVRVVLGPKRGPRSARHRRGDVRGQYVGDDWCGGDDVWGLVGGGGGDEGIRIPRASRADRTTVNDTSAFGRPILYPFAANSTHSPALEILVPPFALLRSAPLRSPPLPSAPLRSPPHTPAPLHNPPAPLPMLHPTRAQNDWSHTLHSIRSYTLLTRCSRYLRYAGLVRLRLRWWDRAWARGRLAALPRGPPCLTASLQSY
jgi:hypothetical protein